MRSRRYCLVIALWLGMRCLPSYGQAVAENLDRSQMPAVAEKPREPCSEDGVVKKGCFSVWAEPRNPLPGRSYKIVIQITPPAKFQDLKDLDLSGAIVGTDGYRQKITGKDLDSIPIADGKAKILVAVPGAAQLVKDTIRVECKRLKESADLELQFK